MRTFGLKLFLLSLATAALVASGAVDASAAPAPPAPPDTYLALTSDSGDYVGAGESGIHTAGTWTASCFDTDNDGPIDSVTIEFVGPEGSGNWWTLSFAAPRGQALEPAIYLSAGNGPDSAPRLSVYGNGRGCSGTPGSFTVLYADFDTTAGELSVRGFAAKFEQHCEGNVPGFYGIVSYQAPSVSEVTGATYSRSKGALTVSGRGLSGATGVVVDGTLYTAKSKSASVVKAKGVNLGEGVHLIAVRRGDGSVTVPFSADFDLGLPGPGPSASSLVVHSDTETPSDYNYAPGVYRTYFLDAGANGVVDGLSFFVETEDGYNPYYLTFSTGDSGPLRVGRYTNANMFGEGGHPGLNLQPPGSGSSCFGSTGSFTITDVAIDYTQGYPKLVRFAASFDYACGGVAPHRTGAIAYYAATNPALARASYDAGSKVLSLSGAYFSKSVQVLVDGKATTATGKANAVTLSSVDLGPGLHVVAVRNKDGRVSRPLLVRV